jgi:threonine dehydratase
MNPASHTTAFPVEWIHAAAVRLRPHLRRTPLQYDPELDVYLKWENQQVTGSFKARGALNKALTLEAWERQAGLVTASAGNHGQGLALAGRLIGAPVIVFASASAPPVKLDAMRALGADLRLTAGGYAEAEQAGLEYARSQGGTWVSPYNDSQVIAGQGTLGLETCEQLPALEHAAWVIPTSGGGLTAGVAAAVKGCPECREKIAHSTVVAVQARASAFMHALYTGGSQDGVPELPSLADGLAGPVEPGSITIPLVRSLVDEFLLVDEPDLSAAVAYAWRRYGQRIEGSAAVSLAVVLNSSLRQRPAVLILSGGNIQAEVHAAILQAHPETRP